MKAIAKLKRAVEMERNVAIALHPPPMWPKENALWPDPHATGRARRKLYRSFGVERFKGQHVTRIRPVPEALWPYRIQEHEWTKPYTGQEAMFIRTLKRYQEDPSTPQYQSTIPRPQIAAQPNLETVHPEIAISKLAPVPLEPQFREGDTRQVSISKYERNPDARQRCIEHYGCLCSVCGFDFEKVYGTRGKGFIHVHHIKALSEIRKEYVIDPISDLRPVCPNCHAIIHSGSEMLTIESLRALIHKIVAQK